MLKSPLAVVALSLVGVLSLAACGGSDDSGNRMSGMGSSTPSSAMSSGSSMMSGFDTADVTFATDMIPHHRQAVEMAQLAPSRAKSAEVRSLAAQIMKAQDPEIQTMSGWLTGWGKAVPEAMSGMDMSGSMPGMMSNEDMDRLKKASGAAFDRQFLTMMIQHHQGAVEMARTEQKDGTSTDATALAQQIEVAQTREIATMRGMLG